METLATRVTALVEQFKGGARAFSEIQTAMRAALTGPFAQEIFGTELPALQSNVEQMTEGDMVGVNHTIHRFSGTLLLKHQALLEGDRAAA